MWKNFDLTEVLAFYAAILGTVNVFILFRRGK